jgi:hypothetical protein
VRCISQFLSPLGRRPDGDSCLLPEKRARSTIEVLDGLVSVGHVYQLG